MNLYFKLIISHLYFIIAISDYYKELLVLNRFVKIINLRSILAKHMHQEPSKSFQSIVLDIKLQLKFPVYSVDKGFIGDH